MAITGTRVSNHTMLLAQIVDAINLLVWFKSEDGQKGDNRPKSVVKLLIGDEEEDNAVGFSSIEEYEAARDKIIRGE